MLPQLAFNPFFVLAEPDLDESAGVDDFEEHDEPVPIGCTVYWVVKESRNPLKGSSPKGCGPRVLQIRCELIVGHSGSPAL